MTTPTTRRAALTALAAVPALAIPAVAIAFTSSPDAELFAMQTEIEAADQRESITLEEQSRVDTAYLARQPPRPSNEEEPVLDAEQLEQLREFRLSMLEKLEKIDKRVLVRMNWPSAPGLRSASGSKMNVARQLPKSGPPRR